MNFKNLLVIFLGLSSVAEAQVTTDPEFPKADEPITFTIDVTGTALEGYTDDLWIWSWIENTSGDIDAPTNVNPATAAQSDALMTRSGSDPNIYTITFTPTDFFRQPASEIEEIGLLLKGQDWSNGQTADYSVHMSEGGLEVSLTAPSFTPSFVDEGATVSIEASASEPADITLKINGSIVSSVSNATKIMHDEVAGVPAKYTIEVIADNGSESVSASSYYIVRGNTVLAPVPQGIIKGINYSGDDTKATLCLLAPMKSSAYVVGAFTNWEIDPQYQMKKDGELFWVEVSGLNPGEEYPFQYLVDEKIYVADPYADKILDPDDQDIPDAAYPDLINFPSQALKDDWYFNRLSVIQTAQDPFQWTTQNYLRPDKKSLVIYELLIRDFFGDGQKNYQNLIDTLSYLSGLGVNAIELMPVMEFNGNDSWGYNPTFMFAPDKFYGTKSKLKEFVDKAHKKGIAVILDIAMNHNDIPAPYAMMYFDFDDYKPTAENPWFNTEAKHPFNVFYDYNHESTYTQDLLDSINNYWLTEYKVDGFRFDLSKGFTQTNSGDNVGLWGNYDASRISLLERMADNIWSVDDQAYVILEHFADNTEEKELSNYGMMLWGNINDAYAQSIMGYKENADLSWGLYTSRGWDDPHLVSYMESHDEERLMYKAKAYGNALGDYSVKETKVGMERIKAASAMFYLLPGPKMLWQFGEFGYDFSINTCPDGSINNDCRVAAKPIPWNDADGLAYNQDEDRIRLKKTVAELIKLKNTYSIFSTSDATIIDADLKKQIILKGENYNANPATADEMNVLIVGNFNIEAATINSEFPHSGAWYDYFGNGSVKNIASTPTSLELAPGEFKIYTDVQLPAPPDDLIGIVTSLEHPAKSKVTLYPNPFDDYINFEAKETGLGYKISITDLSGHQVYKGDLKSQNQSIVTASLANGVYILQLENRAEIMTYKIVKR